MVYLLDLVDMGGGETSFLALARAIVRRGAVAPHVVAPAEGPLTRELQALGVPVSIIPFPRRFRRGLLPAWSPAAARAIERLLAERPGALVHVWHFFGLLCGGPAARRQRRRCLWTCHGAFDLGNLPRRLAARRYADHALCVSESVREVAARVLGDSRATTHYLGIEPFEADASATRAQIRAELGEPAGAPLIGVVGRFQPIKGHDLLLDALPAMRAALPRLRVWVIGDALYGDAAESAQKARIERRVRDEGHAGAVRMLGFRHDARRLMRALDALVIPSFAESFSMVAAEGLEAAIPVIGPDAGGPKEIIDAPATGLRYAAGNAGALAQATVAALLRQGEGARFDPQAGPRRVRELFSVDAHLDRLLDHYRGARGGG